MFMTDTFKEHNSHDPSALNQWVVGSIPPSASCAGPSISNGLISFAKFSSQGPPLPLARMNRLHFHRRVFRLIVEVEGRSVAASARHFVQCSLSWKSSVTEDVQCIRREKAPWATTRVAEHWLRLRDYWTQCQIDRPRHISERDPLR